MRTAPRRLAVRRLAQATLIGIAACWTLPSGAGLLTTEQTLADFNFVGDKVNYAPDPKTLDPAADSTLTFMATDPTRGGSRADNSHDPLRGSLHVLLKGSNYGSFEGSEFNQFGTLPNLSKQSEAALLTDTVAASRSDSKPGPLDFLIARDRITGRLASRYRGAGIFMVVNGVDDLTWVAGFADGAATMELMDAQDGISEPTTTNRGK